MYGMSESDSTNESKVRVMEICSLQYVGIVLFFLPLVSVVNKLNISLVLQLLGSIVLIVVPFVFCHIRYNHKNKYLIGLQYKNKKHWGRRLLIIWSFLLAVIIMEFIVMIKIGFWHIGA